MAHPLPPTLAEVRTAVAIRLSFGPQAAQAPAMRALLDEFIRRAARELVLRAHWVELRVRSDIALVDGQTVYDFPDNMEPGRLERLIVVSQAGDEYALEAGIQPYERAQFLRGTAPTDMPLRYELVNEEIVLLPAPDATAYPTLRVEGYSRPADPQHNDDRIPVDREALIQWATAIGKSHFNQPDAATALTLAQAYLDSVRRVQSDGETIQLGGCFSRKFPYLQPRRASAGAPYWGNNYWLLP